MVGPARISRTLGEERVYASRPVLSNWCRVEIVSRTVDLTWSELPGQQIVIDNRGGPGGNLGAELAAKAIPGGYTLFICQIASQEFAAFIKAETAKWAKVVKDARIPGRDR